MILVVLDEGAAPLVVQRPSSPLPWDAVEEERQVAPLGQNANRFVNSRIWRRNSS